MADDAPARKINALQILGGVLILWQSVLRPLIGSLGDVDTVCNVLQLSHDKCGSGTMIRAVIAGDWWQPVLILVGIALILWGERRRNDALRLATMLPIVSEKEPETDQPPVQPGSGDTLQVTGTVSDPAPGPVLERLLHTCYVLASPQKMKTHGFIELTVVAYNASVKTLILADVLGNARCTMNDEEGKQLKEKLPTPDLMRLAPNRRIAPFTEFVMVLNQAVSPRQAELILATAKTKTVTLDFEDLRLEFSPFQEPSPIARLKLWDGVGISSQKGLRSGRANIMRVQAAVGTSAGVGAVEAKSG